RGARSVRAVLDMPFRHYLMWAYPLSAEEKRFQPGSLADEYGEMYDLTRYLLRTYGGSRKSFYLGNWEGDWHLTHTNPDYTPTDAEVRNMIAWVNMRQKAVDDAKRDAPARNVAVYHYLEVNRVVDAMQGKVRLTNKVLPFTKLDFVSYSAYDAFGGKNLETDLTRLLDYIESNVPAKASITGKRVFIGEYGFPAQSHSDAEQDRRSRQVLRASLAWGCRFCLYWELFNNEVQGGKQVGYWMIDDKNVKQKIYFTHERFYKRARQFVSDFAKKAGRVPTHAEFCRAALPWLE
ncbi:MAG: hypothetical protein H7145_00690, partial [Akkermansiaceae bacterium]|nr:hypothetical protein [Armatimonadota bacterium]